MRRDSMYLAGFDIGGTKSAALIACIRKGMLEFIDRKEIATTRDWKEDMDVLSSWVMGRRKELGSTLAGAGISCGGPLDPERKRILSPPNLPGWDEVPIVSYLEERLGIKVWLENDADACALAEYRYGAGRGSKNMIFLTFGTGLGAGLILDGRLYRGSSGMAGEIGHIRMSESGPLGYYKEGSLEGYASGGGIAKLAKLEGFGGRGGEGGEEKGKTDPDAKEIISLAREGDPEAKRILDISAKYLGRGLSILVDLLNPDMIVLGSIFVRAEDLFRERMEEELRKESLSFSYEAVSIRAALLSERIGDYGAICAALHHLERKE